jgi:rod shape determining protein RodA
VIILFIGGIKLRWFLLGTAILSAVSPVLFFSRLLDDRHRMRLQAPFVPFDQQEVFDPGRELWYWQSDLSIEAISSGGWTGAGLGNGRITQAGILPFQHTDFIFSVAGEELGFVGALLIVVLLVAIVIRCIYVGIRSNNSLGMLVCAGVAAMVTTQLIMNVGMALGVLPVIGIALPFFSYGGSSVVTFFAGMGLVSGIKMRPKHSRYKII